MSGDGVFYIDPNGQLMSMGETAYEAEDVLQSLLETHSELLAGGQMTPGDPRRWALVQREQSVPDRDLGSGRWSIDHLFVDQDAVPTLVEVKRSSDTRIRREVVGQMLDYAANGVRYWPIEDLRQAFEETQRRLGFAPDVVISELAAEPGATVDSFFEHVGDNLAAGRLRMVFVADVIPDELQRIVEFLADQLTKAEVFAVEVKQFTSPGGKDRVIVPGVFGRTAAASARSSRRRPLTRQAQLEAAEPSTREMVTLLAEFAPTAGLTIRETPAAFVYQRDGHTLLTVYVAWNALDFDTRYARSLGLDVDADAWVEDLQSLTTKKLTSIAPSIPSVDVIASFPQVVDLTRRMIDAVARMTE